jgi:YesN/AraC family two-component response regulator
MGYLRPKNFDENFPFYEFLRKPIKEETLITCLRELWGKFDTKPKSHPHVSSASKNLSPQALPLNVLVVEGNYTQHPHRHNTHKTHKSQTHKSFSSSPSSQYPCVEGT